MTINRKNVTASRSEAIPSSKTLGQIIDRLRSQLPKGTLVGGAAAENHDLEKLLSARTPLVIVNATAMSA